MNVLVCIGSDTYDRLAGLSGAEKDARAIFDSLATRSGDYDQKASRLLLSPELAAIQSALNAAFPTNTDPDVFTFFFAGHGAVKAGSFFLCTKDAHPDRLSTTAFPIISLFSLINEMRPRQVNIIVDACQAGGSSFDLGQLVRPEVIGSSQASSIAFLGACSSDQFAHETHEGGVLTQELIKCLTGGTMPQGGGAVPTKAVSDITAWQTAGAVCP